MKFIDKTRLSADDWDEVTFPRPSEQEFDRVVERAISRRGFLSGVVAFGSGAAVMGSALLKATTGQAQDTGRFAFTPISAATDGTVHVPKGYSWKRLVSWGIPYFPRPRAISITRPAAASRCPTRSLAKTPTGCGC